jgi:hypothetical protein
MSRFGLLDLCAVIMLAVVFFLPSRDHLVDPLYAETEQATMQQVTVLQGKLAADPSDGAVAAKLAEHFIAMGQHHYAVRLAGEAAKRGGPSAWRGWQAVSVAHVERVDVEQALVYASKALTACHDPKSDCPEHEYVRLQVYHASLEAGMSSGIDPREDPDGFRRALLKTFPTVHGGKRR